MTGASNSSTNVPSSSNTDSYLSNTRGTEQVSINIETICSNSTKEIDPDLPQSGSPRSEETEISQHEPVSVNNGQIYSDPSPTNSNVNNNNGDYEQSIRVVPAAMRSQPMDPKAAWVKECGIETKSAILTSTQGSHGRRRIRQPAKRGYHGSSSEEEPTDVLKLIKGLEAEGLGSSYFFERRELYHAAMEGDWKRAEVIVNKNKRFASSIVIAENGDTALHIATAANHVHFVKKFVQMIQDSDDLRTTNKSGCTALCYAAVNGSLEMAQAMIGKCVSLPRLADNEGWKPVHYAASILGEHMMVYYLWDLSLIDVNNDNEVLELLSICFRRDIYDKAFDILRQRPLLALKPHVLDQLADKGPTNFNTSAIEKLMPAAIKRLLSVTGIASSHCNVQVELRQLLNTLWEVALGEEGNDTMVKELVDNMAEFAYRAVESGNAMFLSEVIRCYPDVLHWAHFPFQSVFHKAVVYRRENIMRLLDKWGSLKKPVLSLKDQERNVLHLVAGLPHNKESLDKISGAALQMQSEILWFKKIEGIVHPYYRFQKDKEGKTPWAIFTEKHKDMKKEGEEWMKRTTQNLMIILTLIATIIFTAAFTVPGGFKEKSGIPILANEKWYTVFMVSITASFVSSIISMIMFLSILTSAYAEEDFEVRLPLMLFIGLSTLLIASITMVLAFSTTFLLLYQMTTIIRVILGFLAGVLVVFISTYGKLLFHIFMLIKHAIIQDYRSMEATF